MSNVIIVYYYINKEKFATMSRHKIKKLKLNGDIFNIKHIPTYYSQHGYYIGTYNIKK